MYWQWLTGPVVGSVIGYITNDIAVRMMFRPYAEKRLFGWRVPFTPGLIPKERPRLAAAIRDVLDNDLLSADVLSASLLSDAMMMKVSEAADQAMAAVLREQRTPRELLSGAVGDNAFASFETTAKRAVGIFLMEKILDSGFEKTAAEAVLVEAKKRVKGSLAAPVALLLDDKRSTSMEDKLAQVIREMIATHVPQVIDDMINTALHDGLDTPIGALTQDYGDRTDALREFLLTQYAALVQKALPTALRALDLGAVAEAKLNELDMQELEGLIMRVMKKELRAIVWLGALLGAIMGLANAVIGLAL